jgi:hypothetical protein
VWTAESDQAGAELGHAVATAGDVNGDGFDDVIIGAWMYDNGQTDEGRVFVYLANAGSGPEPLSLAGARGRGPARWAGSDLLPAVRLPRQARADDTALIALLGRSDSESAFRLKAIGRSPEGRGRVGLQWEVKRLGDRFDGRNLGASPLFDTGTGSVELNELVTGLTADTPYHWRLRILTVNPFFPRSPWFSPPGNGSGETDLRTAGGASAVIEAPGAAPPRLHLEPARPSPFGRRTALTYTLPQAGRVRLAVYDVQGRERAVLVDAAEAAGRHVVRWDGRDARGAALASGVYVVRLGAAGLDETRKIILAR